MLILRRARSFASLVLAWFVLSLGVAAASPILHPHAAELVCAGGEIKVVVQTDDGFQEIDAAHPTCPLCMPSAALPLMAAVTMPAVLPLAHAVHPIPAARIAAATAAPLPARGPPHLL